MHLSSMRALPLTYGNGEISQFCDVRSCRNCFGSPKRTLCSPTTRGNGPNDGNGTHQCLMP